VQLQVSLERRPGGESKRLLTYFVGQLPDNHFGEVSRHGAPESTAHAAPAVRASTAPTGEAPIARTCEQHRTDPCTKSRRPVKQPRTDKNPDRTGLRR
jgi:hypothetical protein